MNEEQLEDLKRFIANTVSQGVTASEERLTKEMHEGFAGIGDALGSHIEATDEQLANHEHRLTNLEQAALNSSAH